MMPLSSGDKKILFIRTDACVYDPRILKESSSLRAMGYKVFVFGWDRKGEFLREESINNVQYRRTRIRAPYGSRSLVFFLPIFWIRVLWEIFLVRPKVIHACDLDALIPALVIKPFSKIAIIYDIFDHFADKIPRISKFFRSIVRHIDITLMGFADVIIVTDSHRLRLLNNKHLRSISVIMNVPTKRDLPSKSNNRTSIKLCYSGVIHEHRGLYLIAEAIKNLEGVETIFAGWIPRKEDADFLRSQKQIRYLGKLQYSDSLELIMDSDIILALYDPHLPINLYASSNKIFEAMSARCPVITNKETTMSIIVEEEQCGCIIPYGNVDILRSEIVRLRDTPQLRRELGENGYQAFLAKYNWETMENRLGNIYKNIFRESDKSVVQKQD